MTLLSWLETHAGFVLVGATAGIGAVCVLAAWALGDRREQDRGRPR